MILNGVFGNYYNNKSNQTRNEKTKTVGGAFEKRFAAADEANGAVGKKRVTGGLDSYQKSEDVQDIYEMYSDKRKTQPDTENVSAITSCAPRGIKYDDADYVKINVASGYILKAKYSQEDNLVYVEKKLDDGTIQSYSVDINNVSRNSDNEIEKTAISAYILSQSDNGIDNEFVRELKEYAEYVEERIKEGPEKIQIGACEMSVKEWEKLLDKVDHYIEEMKKSMRQDIEKREEDLEEKQLQKESDEETLQVQIHSLLSDRISGAKKAPYSYLADESGIIEYNGVVFVCDNEKQALCLGDMSNQDNVLTIPLSKGGTLKVNRDNLGDLASAITMFSAEDVNLIMRAIAQDAKIQKMESEIDEMINSIVK